MHPDKNMESSVSAILSLLIFISLRNFHSFASEVSEFSRVHTFKSLLQQQRLTNDGCDLKCAVLLY
jgi:hypothetical protein